MNDLAVFIRQRATVLLWALAVVAAAAMLVSAQLQRRRWQRKRLEWQHRLRTQVGVLQTLIADGERTRNSYLKQPDPTSDHERFLAHCDGTLRDHFGESYMRRIEMQPVVECAFPPGATTDQQVFAWYDAERRLAGLRELLCQVEGDLASLDE